MPPSENKGAARCTLGPVWKGASSAIADAEIITAIGFSIPTTDQFFRLFYALSAVSAKLLQQFNVIDKAGYVKERYEQLLGGHARQRLRFLEGNFCQGLGHLRSWLS